MEKELVERDLKIIELKQIARVKESLLAETLKQVEANRKKIVELEKLRDDLTNMIVHDLKNPLTGVVSSNELLLGGQLGPVSPEQKKYLELSQVSIRRMMGLIADLLDLKKLEENKLAVNPTKFKAGDLLADLSWILSPINKEEKQFTSSFPPGLEITADRQLLTRVLANLLTNALKHTRSGGKISLILQPEKGRILFEVKDDGEGIPPEYLGHIFDKFFKVEHQQLKTKIDTGLGLAFSKLAVEAQGGTIGVESAVGKGSRFYFYLPVV